MDFSFTEEQSMLKDTARRFTETELIPLETEYLEREAHLYTDLTETGATKPLIPDDKKKKLFSVAKELGFYGIEVPEEFGGQGLGMLAKVIVQEELGKSLPAFCGAFLLPPDSPNLFWLRESCKGSQVDKYLTPFVEGTIDSAMACSEAGAGSDLGGMTTTAMRKNGKWVIDGSKLWISKAGSKVFFIVIAVTDKNAPPKDRFTAFLVDKNTPGLTIGKVTPVISPNPTWPLYLDGVEVGDDAVLGEVGKAFVPLSSRFGIRRLGIAANCVGMAHRLIQKMITFANERKTWGEFLSQRQTVQNWVADSQMELDAIRLSLYRAAWKIDQGHKDLRFETAALKVQAPEMLTHIADRAIQLHGGMGLARETGIEIVYRSARLTRIGEGPSEIHRFQIAKALFAAGKPHDHMSR